MTRFIAMGAPLALVPLLVAAPVEAQGTRAHVTLTGGPQAGSYEMTAASACGAFDSGSKDDGFGASFVADAPRGWHKGPPYLSHLSLSTPRMRNPKPDELWLAAVFTKWGTPETEIKYEVFTIPGGHKLTGHGEAKVQRTAGGLSATFRGETADGVRIEGNLQCS
jgi:hypothetical protein